VPAHVTSIAIKQGQDVIRDAYELWNELLASCGPGRCGITITIVARPGDVLCDPMIFQEDPADPSKIIIPAHTNVVMKGHHDGEPCPGPGASTHAYAGESPPPDNGGASQPDNGASPSGAFGP
jgi:hypothetical protein